MSSEVWRENEKLRCEESEEWGLMHVRLEPRFTAGNSNDREQSEHATPTKIKHLNGLEGYYNFVIEQLKGSTSLADRQLNRACVRVRAVKVCHKHRNTCRLSLSASLWSST